MTARKYKWNVIRSTICIYPDVWNSYVFETLHLTKKDAEKHIAHLNENIQPCARKSVKYSLEKKKNV